MPKGNPNGGQFAKNTVDLTNYFTSTPTMKEVKEFLNKMVEEGKEFATSSPDWFVDIPSSSRKKDHIAKSSQFQRMNKSQKNRHNKYVIGHWFSIVEEDSLNLQSQITDNYIENNTAVQDHIALSPVVITLRGYVGEVEFKPPTVFTNYLTDKINNYTSNTLGITVSDKLGALSALLPPVDNVNQMARNAVQYVESSFNRYKRIYNQLMSLSKKGQKQVTESVQQYVAKNLKEMWENRTLVEVVTPYGLYKNMAIQSITLTQGNTTTQSELSVSLKQLNFAETQTTKPDTDRMAKYNAIQRAEVEDCGKAQGVKVPTSILYEKWKG